MSFLFSRWGNWGPERLGRFYGDSQPGSRELAFDFATPLFSPVYWTASSGKPLLSTSAQHLLGQFPLISLNHSPLFHQWIFCVNGKNKSIQRHCEVALLSAGCLYQMWSKVFSSNHLTFRGHKTGLELELPRTHGEDSSEPCFSKPSFLRESSTGLALHILASTFLELRGFLLAEEVSLVHI